MKWMVFTSEWIKNHHTSWCMCNKFNYNPWNLFSFSLPTVYTPILIVFYMVSLCCVENNCLLTNILANTTKNSLENLFVLIKKEVLLFYRFFLMHVKFYGSQNFACWKRDALMDTRMFLFIIENLFRWSCSLFNKIILSSNWEENFFFVNSRNYIMRMP